MRTSIRPLHLLALCATFLLAACGDSPSGEPGPGPGPEPGEPPARMEPAWALLPGDVVDAGALIPTLPMVRVLDAAGKPVKNVGVTFEVTAGGGRLSGAGVGATNEAGVTDAAGYWTTGSQPGEQRLTARAGNVSTTLVVTAREKPPEWQWTRAAAPLGDLQLGGLLIHPLDDRVWLASSMARGLYRSADGGATWRLALAGAGLNRDALRVDPLHPDTVFAAVGTDLYVSGDRGATWTLRHAFPREGTVRSLLVSARDGALLAGMQRNKGLTPGIYRSEDRGRTWTLHPLGGGTAGQWILTWVVAEDPATGTLYAGNEIADHPQPYRAPFFRSTDGGRTWTDITGGVPFPGRPWHIIQIGFAGSHVLALSEGAGLYRSSDGGQRWESLGFPFDLSLRTDPRDPQRVFGGTFNLSPAAPGVVVMSRNGGRTFQRVGTLGSSVSDLALSADGRRLYATAYGSGIMTAEIPAAP